MPDYSKIQKVFGTTWKPSPAFTPEIQKKGIYGAVRVKGTPEVYTLGAGTPTHLTAETYKATFGTASQAGIVGEISPEQAGQFGILGYGAPAPTPTPTPTPTPPDQAGTKKIEGGWEWEYKLTQRTPTGGVPQYSWQKTRQLTASEQRDWLKGKEVTPPAKGPTAIKEGDVKTEGALTYVRRGGEWVYQPGVAAVEAEGAPAEGEPPTSPIESIQKVFGPDWEPAPAFTPEMQAKGIFGAVRIKGQPTVFTLGPGGTAIRSPEEYKALFGTLSQEGIVGEVSLEEAKSLGITETGGLVGTSDAARLAEEDEEAEKEEDEAKTIKDLTTEADKLTLQQQIADLKASLGLDIDKPDLPTLTSDFETLRSEYGVAALEGRLNQINKDVADVEASVRAGLYDEEGKLRPMELIGTRQRELARQGQEQLDTLNRSKAVIIDELNTKNALISNLMNLKQTDFANASALYNSEFTRQIQLLNILEGRETREKQEENMLRDDARANLNILMDSIEGMDWTEVSADVKSLINTLSVKADLPANLVPAILENVNPAKEKSFHVISADQTKVSIFYKDGSVEVFSTGLPAKPKTGDKPPTFKFSSDDVGRLMEKGLTQAEIQGLQLDIASRGIDAAISGAGLTEDQEKVTRQVLKGITPSQAGKEKDVTLSKEYFRGIYTEAILESSALETLVGKKATEEQIKEAAKKAGFRGFWTKWSTERENYINHLKEEYLDYLMRLVEQYRDQGYSDAEILDRMK